LLTKAHYVVCIACLYKEEACLTYWFTIKLKTLQQKVDYRTVQHIILNIIQYNCILIAIPLSKMTKQRCYTLIRYLLFYVEHLHIIKSLRFLTVVVIIENTYVCKCYNFPWNVPCNVTSIHKTMFMLSYLHSTSIFRKTIALISL